MKPHEPAACRRSTAFGLACLLLVLWFGALDQRALFHPDEGRYAEIPREMLASGDWVTPRLNGLKYFEKPILQYWITAAAFSAFGKQEFVARLWPASAGFLTLLLVYYTGRRLAGVRAGVVAAALLASTFQFFVFSQLLTLDMGLTLFLTLALCAFLRSQDTRAALTQRRNWTLLIWVAMGLAVLSKGLVGVVLPALVLIAYILIERDWKFVARLQWRLGPLVFLAIVLPWFVWVQWRNPEFFQFFFVREHFARYAQSGHHREGAWYYFLGVLVVGSLPWSFAYIKTALASWRKPRLRNFEINPLRVLVLWIAIVTLFYSVSASKLPGYILPVYPAFALLVGCQVERERLALSLPTLLLAAIVGIATALCAAFLTHIPKFAEERDLIARYVAWAAAGGCVLAGAAVLAILLRRRYAWLAGCAVVFGTLTAFQVLVSGTQSIEPALSSEGLVDQALHKIGSFEANAPFYSVDMYDQTLPYYLGRTLTLVNYRSELEMGIAQEPERAIATIDEFRRRWRAHRQAYASMPRKRFDQEQLAGTPAILLAANRKTVIVARAAPN
jgi:4-amino-4-deoxy-L-arabinose transferase-like glycosyltransferase